MLEIKNVSKTYHLSNHSVEALKDISLQIRPGNLVAIVGVSGSGKTSLMNIIGALDSDFNGDIVVNGQSLKQAQSKDIDTYRKNSVGFIFQHFVLINSLNTYENVALPLDISNYKKSEKKKIVDNLLKGVGLESHKNKKVNVLSGGQKQRVAIARALANNPDIILADEPTGALDYKNGLQIMDILKQIAEDKIVILVTHSNELAQQYADVIVTLEDGSIVDIDYKKAGEVIDLNEEKQEINKSKSKMGIFKAFQLGYRNLKLKKVRTIVTSIGMSIGIVGIALALALSSGTKKAIEDQVLSIFPANMVYASFPVDNLGELSDVKKLSHDDYQNILKLADKATGHYFGSDYISPTIMSLDKDSADVTKVQQHMQDLADNKEEDKESETAISMVGMINFSNSYQGSIAYGKKPTKDEPFELMISLSTAQELIGKDEHVKTLIGENLYISMFDMKEEKNKIATYEITGITSENTLLSTLYVTKNFSEGLLSRYFDTNIEDVKSSAVVLVINDRENIKEYVKKLNAKQDEYKFTNMSDSVLDTTNTILDVVTSALIAFSSVSVVVAILMIAIVIYISVLERRQEIGLIRAIGAKTKDIRNMFLAESLSIGLLAGTIGVGVAYLISLKINDLVWQALKTTNENIPLMKVANLDLQTAALIIIGCGLLSVISGLIPSLKAAKLDPIDAIRKK